MVQSSKCIKKSAVKIPSTHHALIIRLSSHRPALWLVSCMSIHRCSSHAYLYILLFINFSSWLHWVFIAVLELSQVAASRRSSSLWCVAFSLRWPLCRSSGLGARAPTVAVTGSVVVAQGLACSMARGIFPDPRSNPIPCTHRRILILWTTREVLFFLFTFTDNLCHTLLCTLLFLLNKVS